MNKTIVALFATVAAIAVPAVSVQATTVGNPAVNRGIVDSSAGLTYILDQGFGATFGRLTSYNLFSGRSGDVTPLLFNRVDTPGASSFTLLGIGTTRNVGTGVYTFDFGLTQGTDLTGTNAFFGFRTVSRGVVSWTYQDSALPGMYATTVPTATAGVGTTFTFDPAGGANDNGNGLNYRTYSINATVTAVPEPASWAMMIGGVGLVGGALRRHKSKVSTKVAFA